MTKQEKALERYNRSNSINNDKAVAAFGEQIFLAIVKNGKKNNYVINITEPLEPFDIKVVVEKLKEDYPALKSINNVRQNTSEYSQSFDKFFEDFLQSINIKHPTSTEVHKTSNIDAVVEFAW